MIEYVLLEKNRNQFTGIEKLYRYVIASNGVFIRASSSKLQATFPISECELRGLREEKTSVFLVTGVKVPLEITEEIFSLAKAACVNNGEPVEWMCYLHYDAEGWRMMVPEQHATRGSVAPTQEDYEANSGCLIELHSHNQMPAFWSHQDDADEQGFKLYAVIGKIFSKPTLRVRVGVYGYFYEVDAEEIFELPDWVNKEKEEE